ncbi:MAG: NAD-dependent epimerase/dehydratase family protein [Chloroflexi bacterium]|nr:NAD-dependent epimerase/dehydratase family protein [Chloroflexota bacterium]
MAGFTACCRGKARHVKFLVTGATGFIGGVVARHLVVRGHEVRALVRSGHDLDAIRAEGWIPVAGDLLDSASLAPAVEGVDGVFHVAALYTFWSRESKLLYQVNVDGTRAVLDSARHAGVRRVVYTSSVGVLRAPPASELADETFDAEPAQLPDHYHRSKLLGERAALAANGSGLEVVAVNPTAPVGPGDVRPTPTGRIVLEFLKRRRPGYVDVDLNIVDVEDVAAGHLAAFERGRPGERYILGGLNTDLAGVYKLLARATGLRRRPVRIPYSLAMAAACADELFEGRLLRRQPYVPINGVRATRHPVHVDCSKAIRELGLPQSSPERALGAAAAWFVDRGYVRDVSLPATAQSGAGVTR